MAELKIGRPKKEFDKRNFEYLCALHCTEDEIAGFFQMGRETLRMKVEQTYEGRCFRDVSRSLSMHGKISLRRNQFKLAKRHPAMAVFLGKQILEQKDDSPTSIEVNVQNNNDGRAISTGPVINLTPVRSLHLPPPEAVQEIEIPPAPEAPNEPK